jgi:hypothetical protein
MIVKLFPTIVVDNFLESPDYVRNRALKLDFHPTDGTWPGKRTLSLNQCDPELFEYLCKKFFSLHYDFLNRVDWKLTAHFQLIEPFDDDKQHTFNRGWIHTDHNKLLAGILYLTPDADPDTGTSLFKPKTAEIETKLLLDDQIERIEFYKNDKKLYSSNKQDAKEDLYNNKEIDLEYYSKRLNEFNSQFDETVHVKNIYNRLICFDANEWHAANNFQTGTGSRLTLVYFVDSVDSVSIPALERVRQYKI